VALSLRERGTPFLALAEPAIFWAVIVTWTAKSVYSSI
jgi:hypothetical protein